MITSNAGGKFSTKTTIIVALVFATAKNGVCSAGSNGIVALR
jgi:hypothetical protein